MTSKTSAHLYRRRALFVVDCKDTEQWGTQGTLIARGSYFVPGGKGEDVTT